MCVALELDKYSDRGQTARRKLLVNVKTLLVAT